MSERGVDFDLEQIKAMIPHRHPFLLIDRVLNCIRDKSGTGVKYVSANEPFLRNVPPGGLALPDVLVVEAMAQTAAVGAMYTLGGNASRNMLFLTGVKDARFYRPVKPGDTLYLHMEKERSFGPNMRVRGRAQVEERLVAEACLTALTIEVDGDFSVDGVSSGNRRG